MFAFAFAFPNPFPLPPARSIPTLFSSLCASPLPRPHASDPDFLSFRARPAPPAVAFSRCVGSISSSFSGKEQTCLANCVDRFFDTSDYLVRRVTEKRTQAGL